MIYKVISINYSNTIDQNQLLNEYKKGIFNAAVIKYNKKYSNNIDFLYIFQQLNIPYAISFHSYARDVKEAKEEARQVLTMVNKYHPWCIYYDIEEYYNKDVIDTFYQFIQMAGYRMGIYTNQTFFDNYMRGDCVYPLWIANFSKQNLEIPAICQGCHFSSTEKVNGIAGNVDLSYFCINLWVAGRQVVSRTELDQSGIISAIAAYHNTPPQLQPEPSKIIPQISYTIQTLKHGYLMDTFNNTKTGIFNDPIVKIKVSSNVCKIFYKVHLLNKGWMPWVSGNSWYESTGHSGDGMTPIDDIQFLCQNDNYEIVYNTKRINDAINTYNNCIYQIQIALIKKE